MLIILFHIVCKSVVVNISYFLLYSYFQTVTSLDIKFILLKQRINIFSWKQVVHFVNGKNLMYNWTWGGYKFLSIIWFDIIAKKRLINQKLAIFFTVFINKLLESTHSDCLSYNLCSGWFVWPVCFQLHVWEICCRMLF